MWMDLLRYLIEINLETPAQGHVSNDGRDEKIKTENQDYIERRSMRKTILRLNFPLCFEFDSIDFEDVRRSVDRCLLNSSK